MKTVWRVDAYLLTLVEVEYNEEMPLNAWIPASYGEGAYAYVEHYEEAKNVLVDAINHKIKRLEELRDELKGEEKCHVK